MAELAVGTFGTEASQVVGAGGLLDVLGAAVGPVLAEAAGEPRAGLVVLLVDDVAVRALGVGALGVLAEEPAGRHLGHVVLVQELALGSLFAQAAQPVLAHQRLGSRVVAVRAAVFAAALAFGVEGAHLTALFVLGRHQAGCFVGLPQVFFKVELQPEGQLVCFAKEQVEGHRPFVQKWIR